MGIYKGKERVRVGRNLTIDVAGIIRERKMKDDRGERKREGMEKQLGQRAIECIHITRGRGLWARFDMTATWSCPD